MSSQAMKRHGETGDVTQAIEHWCFASVKP
jgi:hypothetical protein